MNIDFNKLKNEFPFLSEMNPTDVFDFLKQTQAIKLKPGDVFLKEGSIKSNVYFVKQGLIRSYFINEKGKEITNRLRYENQVLAPYETIYLKHPSRFIFQALEETELLVIDFEEMRKILDRNQKLETARRFFVSHILAETLTALDDFILLSPEDRYLKFIKEHPLLHSRVPSKFIANILGITPVSLSRIRKRVASKKR